MAERDPLVTWIEVVRRVGWPAVVIAVLMSGFASKVLDLLIALVEQGVGHFWLAVIGGGAGIVWIGIPRRLTTELERKNEQVQTLADRNSDLVERNTDLTHRVKQLESRGPAAFLPGPERGDDG